MMFGSNENELRHIKFKLSDVSIKLFNLEKSIETLENKIKKIEIKAKINTNTEINKDKCKWHYEDGDYYYVTSCKKECPASEFRQVADEFVFCPYCRKEIEEIKDASIS